MNKLNNKELADLLAIKAQISESEAELFLKELFKLVAETISETEIVKIKDFGTFKLTRVQTRESVDVNTGEKIEIPSHLKVSFLPAPVLKDLVNKPFSHFETTLLNGDTSFSEISESEEKENDDEDTATDNFQSEIIENVETSETSETLENVKTTKTAEISENKNTTDPLDAAETIENTEVSETVGKTDFVETLENASSTKTIENTEVSETVGTNENISVTDNRALNNKIEITETTETSKTTESSVNTYSTNNINATESLNKTSLKQKRKRTEIWIPILGSVVVIGALIFFFTQGIRKTITTEDQLHESSLVKIASKTNLTDTIGSNVDTTKVSSLTPTSKLAEKVILEPGKTLRIIALDKFGNRDFWIYIYLTNNDKIKNPDVIPVGTELIMPDAIEFDIDSKNPASVSKAKKLGDITMKNLSNY